MDFCFLTSTFLQQSYLWAYGIFTPHHNIPQNTSVQIIHYTVKKQNKELILLRYTYLGIYLIPSKNLTL
jgi:hypothetical protein